MSTGLRSTRTTTPPGTPGSAVLVDTAVMTPAPNASNTAAVEPNSRGTGREQPPTGVATGLPVTVPTLRPAQLRTNAVRSRPPHWRAVASVTANAALSSAATA